MHSLPERSVVCDCTRVRNAGGSLPEAIIDHSFADDGVALDPPRGLVYISEVASPTHNVLVYNATARTLVRTLKPRGVHMLDDFTLSADGTELIGADFGGGRVVAFPVLGSSVPHARTLLSGVTNPTSVRRGCVPVDDARPGVEGLGEDMLFVSEGGALSRTSTDRRVLAFRMKSLSE